VHGAAVMFIILLLATAGHVTSIACPMAWHANMWIANSSASGTKSEHVLRVCRWLQSLTAHAAVNGEAM